MREIKFRGQRMDTNEWAYGSLLISEPEGKLEPLHYFICSIDKGMHRVKPDTIGQYTGLKDSALAEIYEGDILECTLGWKYVVEWEEDTGRFIGFTIENERKTCYVGREPKSKMIGNIFENPELLELS